jgi:HprK-related kinase A
VVFLTDIPNPYPSFPVEHHFALFEWGFNWCIAILAQQFVMLHSAVLEKNGQALILPAFPGSGKSTLCASLVLKGWRLLSDEFGLYRPETGELTPLPRPIGLKNASIDVLRGFSPDARFGPVFRGTHKGDVAHMHPPADSIEREKEPATPRWIVFPQYKQDSKTQLLEYAKGPAFLKLAGNSFNYRLQGARGFRALNTLVKNCDTHYLEFDNLDHAHEKIARLTTL